MQFKYFKLKNVIQINDQSPYSLLKKKLNVTYSLQGSGQDRLNYR
jgi:hypothetical protein